MILISLDNFSRWLLFICVWGEKVVGGKYLEISISRLYNLIMATFEANCQAIIHSYQCAFTLWSCFILHINVLQAHVSQFRVSN